MKTQKYQIDKVTIGGFILYTIWDNEKQKPLFDFYSKDFKNYKEARNKAELKLIELQGGLK